MRCQQSEVIAYAHEHTLRLCAREETDFVARSVRAGGVSPASQIARSDPRRTPSDEEMGLLLPAAVSQRLPIRKSLINVRYSLDRAQKLSCLKAKKFECIILYTVFV